MKKTISVNLANRNFYVEEDAYYVLDQYIKGIREYYLTDDPEGEIVGDFEMRLGELFAEKMRLGHEVVTLDLAKEVISQLGRIEDLEATEGGEEEPSVQSPSGESSQPETSEASAKKEETFAEKLNKKLYRDPKHKWLGGIIAGLSVHLGVDVALLRLVAVLLLFTPLNWIFVVLYIVGWMVLPEATEATDRLRMEGKPLTSQNLWQTISSETPGVKTNEVTVEPETEVETKEKRRNNILWWIVAFFLVLFIVGALIWGIVAIGEGTFFPDLPFGDSSSTVWVVGLSILLAIFGLLLALMILAGIITLVYIWPFSIILRSKSLNTGTKIVIIALWIILTTFWIWL
ncbi:PspC domain-containing protein [Porphyromonas somerae]|uniref:PspC domain-containing protein n=1 Tax=Porphyromonas somerae TaxID=322095 RepID=UPI002A751F2A|nr:PspC domain-containing protein [Porphyromonas somerae]MDY3120774.1 PspC domain-containing protein [Porphyromonas somerae]